MKNSILGILVCFGWLMAAFSENESFPQVVGVIMFVVGLVVFQLTNQVKQES